MLHCKLGNKGLAHAVDQKLEVAQAQMVKGKPSLRSERLRLKNGITYFFGTCKLSSKDFVRLEYTETSHDGISCRNSRDNVSCHLFHVEPGFSLNSEHN